MAARKTAATETEEISQTQEADLRTQATTEEGVRYRHPWKQRRFEMATTPEREETLLAEGWRLAPYSKAEAQGQANAGLALTTTGGATGAASTTPAGSTTTTTPASPAGSSGSVTVNG